MNWIEIIGPSGIGKSTLLKAVGEERSDKNREWVFLDEAFIEIAKNRKRDSYQGIKNKLQHVLLKQGFFSNLQEGLALRLLQDTKGIEKALKNYNFLMEPYLEKILKEDKDAMFKSARIGWYYGILKSAAIIDAQGYEKTVVFDEGLFYNNKNGFVELNKTEDWVLPKGVISCRLSADKNFERIKKRKWVMSYHRGLTDQELYENIKTVIRKNELKLEKFKAMNVPVLEISLSEIDEALISSVGKFIIDPLEAG